VALTLSSAGTSGLSFLVMDWNYSIVPLYLIFDEKLGEDDTLRKRDIYVTILSNNTVNGGWTPLRVCSTSKR
jgi:hypothetical protein